MGLRCGIVGLPNVGKSTLFNALTKASVAAENYPFCTLEPNVGVVPVPDPRLARIAAIAGAERVVAATVEFVDIAGLVAGASRGEGLGNRFLAHIREVDAIVHVVRAFDDPDVAHVAGRVDPVSDIETVHTELALADLQTIERQLAKHEKPAQTGRAKEAQRRVAVLKKAQAALDVGRPARALDWAAEERALLEPLCLLTMKPTLYVANVAEHGFCDNPRLAEIERRAAAEGAQAVAICAVLEAQIADLAPDEQRAFLAPLGLSEPGLARLVHAAYALLGLQTFFTAGPKEARAWQLRAGRTAVEAAGTIHSDFARGFIRAEVIAYEDYLACGGEQGAKEAGKMRLEGRDYVVRDGDVIRFRFNV
ncbi:MAG: redox-regulated ATPase YchF [Burkholderiales bacterium]|nr:redox-regulated ATPase YchF [Burkholderiales bacterium]